MPNSVINTRDLMEKIMLVPTSLRSYNADSDMASKHYGIDLVLLEKLTGLGLPFMESTGQVLYSSFDLSNISLHLRLPSIQRLAMRMWARTLQTSVVDPPSTAIVSVFPIGVCTDTATPLKVLTVPLRDRNVFAHGLLKDLIDEWAGFSFYMLPEECRWDIDFIERSRICECGGASKRMIFQAWKHGIEARQCFGLLVAAPFSTGHYWAEFNLDGEWIAFDPLLLSVLSESCGLDRQAWPSHRSSSAILHRLCVIDRYDANGVPILDRYVDQPYVSNPLVIMDNQVLAVSLPTKIMRGQPS